MIAILNLPMPVRAGIGLGANRPQDAVYPTSLKAADGAEYDGANRYSIQFAKEQTPPVAGFWSITMYDSQYFFVATPLNRYSINPRQDLKANADGSVDIYIQHDSPGVVVVLSYGFLASSH